MAFAVVLAMVVLFLFLIGAICVAHAWLLVKFYSVVYVSGSEK